MTDAARIAAGLSEHQRDLLLNTLSTEWTDALKLRCEPNALRGWAGKVGLLEARSGKSFYHVRLSWLGEQVIAHLKGQTDE